jgi:hypothetical protein
MSLDALQAHTVGRELELPARSKELYYMLRGQLLSASDEGKLSSSPDDIIQHVRRLSKLSEFPPQVAADLRRQSLDEGAFCIVVGRKINQNRDRTFPHLTRDDGAWFDFTITGRERQRSLELLSYGFEIRFPPGMGTPFLRFDLNLPDHRNEARELRCHLHPGSDDVLVPAPLMSPRELLAIFIDGARPAIDREKRRAPTAFETSWYEETHVLTRPRPHSQ